MCAENICAEQKSHQSQRWTHSLGDCWWLPKNKYDVSFESIMNRHASKYSNSLKNFKRETASETIYNIQDS